MDIFKASFTEIQSIGHFSVNQSSDSYFFFMYSLQRFTEKHMKANSVDILQDNIKETDEQVNTVTFEYDAKSHHPDNSSWLYYQVQRNT